MVRASAVLCAVNVVASIYSSDWRLLFASLGLALLCTTLNQMNPCGVTLACESIRHASSQWHFKARGASEFLPCKLQSTGRLASVLWLHCVLQKPSTEAAAPAKTLLIFYDAMSEEQWRLFRRQIRLQLHAARD
ncbi:hypothetical protein R0135_01765 [Congregibacter variabilis]|uniref:Toxin CptA n=1 Tax=Congregibacter variabilis TaxID=3081200 RepID=A0ABZ0I325_9GAMM|nr:hypothetical protein R0135_01765 [Congregibacter sp. IMCC43200]